MRDKRRVAMTAQCDLAVVVVAAEEEGLGWWREKRLGRVVVVVERSWSFIVGSIILLLLLLLLGFEATRVRAFGRRIKVRGGIQERESCEMDASKVVIGGGMWLPAAIGTGSETERGR